MFVRHKVMRGCECFISPKSMNSIQNSQNRSSGEMTIRIVETYNNYMMTHGFRIHKTAPGITMEECIPLHILNMQLLTGNVYYDVVSNFQVLSYQVNN